MYSIGLRYQDLPFTDQYGNAFKYRAALNPNPLDGKSNDGRWTYDVFLMPFKTAATANCTRQPKQAVGATALEQDHKLR